MATFTGTAGGDDIVGTAGDDLFKLQDGGNEDVNGDAGHDVFRMGAELTAADISFLAEDCRCTPEFVQAIAREVK